jgi:hypothetical protein
MKEFVLDYLDNACRSAVNPVACRRNHPGADLFIDMDNGATIAIYVINRALRIPEIKERFEENTARRVYTLFIIDGRMMPEDSVQVAPPDWMSALHTISNGRIYTYWCEKRNVFVRPVHMEWKWGGEQRAVEYGPAIDINKLRTAMSDLTTKHIRGYFAVADFGDADFWKKRDPADGKQYKYSWRQWNYGSHKKQTTAEEEDANWDPWKDFARTYDDFSGAPGGESTYQNKGRNQRSRQNQQTARPNGGNSNRAYALLGVSTSASFEEVKQAYRKKARENHPDLHPEDKEKYTARMADINAAFETITRRLK